MAHLLNKDFPHHYPALLAHPSSFDSCIRSDIESNYGSSPSSVASLFSPYSRAASYADGKSIQPQPVLLAPAYYPEDTLFQIDDLALPSVDENATFPQLIQAPAAIPVDSVFSAMETLLLDETDDPHSSVANVTSTQSWFQNTHSFQQVQSQLLEIPTGTQPTSVSYSMPNYAMPSSSINPFHMLLEQHHQQQLIDPTFSDYIYETGSETSVLHQPSPPHFTHRRSHSTGDIPFQSQYLNQPAEAQQRHLTPFKCRFCGDLFPIITTLRQHVQTRHADITARELARCQKRIEENPIEEEEEDTKKFKKDERKRAFECSVCSKAFYRKQDLKRHAVTHIEGFKPYECHICQVRFTRADALNRHVKAQRCHR